jgi:ribonuclease VapC
MVVDTSALLAIYLAESDSSRFEAVLIAAAEPVISAGTLLEAGIVVETRHGKAGAAELDALLGKLGISLVDVDAEQVDAARLAFRKYGKGRHSANLNYGDCFAYALAITRGQPLLLKGGDFSKTDVMDALASD